MKRQRDGSTHEALAEYCRVGDLNGATETLESLAPRLRRDLLERLPSDGGGGRTPLSLAVMSGNAELVRVLATDYGASLTEFPRSNDPLGVASSSVREGVHEMVAMLVELGAKCDCGDRRGNTPLSDACLRDDERAVEALLFAGCCADVGAGRLRPPVPLVVSCCRGSWRVCELLIQAGAGGRSWKVEGVWGALVNQVDDPDTIFYAVDFLVSHGLRGVGDDAVLHALVSDSEWVHGPRLGVLCTVAQLAIDRGADLQALDPCGRTPSEHAVFAGSVLCQVFLDKGHSLAYTRECYWPRRGAVGTLVVLANDPHPSPSSRRSGDAFDTLDLEFVTSVLSAPPNDTDTRMETDVTPRDLFLRWCMC